MKDLAIYGAGGFGREVACLVNLINQEQPTWNIIGFFDDGIEKGTTNKYGKILGGIDELNAWNHPLDIAIAIGNPSIVHSVANNIHNSNIGFPNVIAPTTVWLDKDDITLGQGNIVCSNSLLSCNVRIGDFNIFNGYVTIGHDVTIGNFNSIMPAVRISGEVTIGNGNFFGVNSVVLQRVKIGNNTRIGANALIIKKTKDGKTYASPPAHTL